MTNGVKCWCQHCGRELEPSHTGKCPYCGESGKRCEATASVAIGLKVSASAEKTRVYFEWGNRSIGAIVVAIVVDIVIALVGTLIGFFVGSAIIGFASSLPMIVISNVYFERRVRTKIREITRYL